jgi:uncharacterized NAD-dependent epimerase/dehydratase family protein
MKTDAIIYSENEFGKVDGKVANGLIRHSERYTIIGVIDSSKAGFDAGEHLDGVKNGIPIFQNLTEAIKLLDKVPNYFIYGIAPLTSFLDNEQRAVILSAMKMGMNIVNGMPEFLSDDEEFIQIASEYNVQIHDIRKPPERKKMHTFSGRIHDVKTPVIVIMGTDCAVGKRTTAVKLVEALKQEGLKAVFIATGQTGIIQGAKYGIAVDVLSSGFATGEVEHAIVTADKNEQPDIIVVEGQGALSHPAFTSSSAILKGAKPDAVIIQDPPKRKYHCDFPGISLPPLANEIELIETFSETEVIAITLNHEDMTDYEIENTIMEYENIYKLPTTDVLEYGCNKLINRLLELFPKLRKLSDAYEQC